MNPTRRGQVFVLVFTCLMVMMNMYLKTMPSVLSVDFIRDFGLSATALSAFSAATMLGFGIMQIPSGIITDVLGGRKTLCGLFLLAGTSVILFAVTESYGVAVTARFLTGLGIAVTVPGLTLLARWFSNAAYARANSVYLTVGAFGPLLASGPLAMAIEVWPWRTVIMASGMFCLTLAVLVWLLVPVSPQSAALAQPAAGKAGFSPAQIWDNMRLVVRRRIFWVMAVWMACGPGIAMAFFALWWGPYLIQGCGMSQTEAGSTLTMIFLLTLPAMPLIGIIYSSFITNRGILLRLLSVGGFLSVAGLIWASGRGGMGLHVALGCLFQTTTSSAVTVLYTSMKEIFPLRMVGTALGCLNTVLPLSVMAWQNLFGFKLDHSASARAGDMPGAFAEALTFFAGAMIVAFVATFFMTRAEAVEE